MRSYPKSRLPQAYYAVQSFSWFSARLPDYTNRKTVRLLNFATNLCEKWETFLDVGAGDGRYSRTLGAVFTKGYAVESSESECFTTISRDFPNVTCVSQYIQDAKIKKDIDFVLLADVFEHIPLKDVRPFVRKVGALQNKGGVVFLLTPNAIHCGPALLSGIYHKILKDGHYKHYLKEELDSLFVHAGYTSILTIYEDSYFRLLIKTVMMVISSIDKRICSNRILELLTLPGSLLLNIVFRVLGRLAIVEDSLHAQDVYGTQTIINIYKKI